MDSHHFDALTRRWHRGSRRQALSALAAGLFLRVSDAEEAAAACKGFNAKCKRNANCCADQGLRCLKVGKGGKGKKKRRCRCKNGTCPPQSPCCIGGKCQELCDGACCADCFVPTDFNGVPMPNQPVCCVGNAGTVCGPNPKKTSDDRCCYPEEDCVGGRCCCDGCRGSVVCGGECCAIEACCNGQCCGPGQVCVTTPTGDQCLSAGRFCEIGEPDCFSGESCVGDTCCSGERICGAVCCAADEYCEMPGQECCQINSSCGAGSFKGHRVRR